MPYVSARLCFKRQKHPKHYFTWSHHQRTGIKRSPGSPCSPRSPRRPVSMTKCQSLSTFSSENLSVSDGEEGHTTDHSHSGTPDVVSTNTDDKLDDKSDDLLSQGSEIPADPQQLASDGLSEKEAALQQVKTQLTTDHNSYQVGGGGGRGGGGVDEEGSPLWMDGRVDE